MLEQGFIRKEGVKINLKILSELVEMVCNLRGQWNMLSFCDLLI